jgi:outer membrane protein OmpA-like peptidoglycan-associated protein
MKTLLASLILAALTLPAAAGPDFTAPSPRGGSLSASPATSEIGPLDDVTFATGSTVLGDASRAQIETAARWLRRHGDQRIVLEGYADSVGMTAYNEDLATRRAFVVKQALVGHGVRPDRVVIVVYGETGANGGEDPLDRRVVMYATKLAPQQVATASIDQKHAITAVWTDDKAIFSETRGNRGRTVIGTK